MSNTKDNLVDIQGSSNIVGNTQVNITGGKVEVAGNVQGGSVNIAAVKKRNEDGTVEKSDDNELVIGDAAQIKSTSGKTVLQAGGYNKELSELKEQISGKVELDGVTIDPDGTGWDVTDVSFDSGKDMAKDIFAQDKEADGIRKDFQSLAQSINRADADKAKKDAMVAGVLAAVDEQMKSGNGGKMKNIHMDVLRSYEGSKPDMEASDNALKREINGLHEPEMAEVPEAEMAAEPELIDVTFSEA